MNTNDEKSFYKVFHQEMEYNWKYLLNDYHIVPLVSGFENQLDRFVIVGVPFYLQRYCFTKEDDERRNATGWYDLGSAITSFALEGCLKEQVKDAHLIYLKDRYEGFNNKTKNINLTAAYSIDRMEENRQIYDLMKRLVVATGKYLSGLRFKDKNITSLITGYTMSLESSMHPVDEDTRKYIGMETTDYNGVIWGVNEDLIRYYKQIHLWEIDDLYYALTDSEHFLQQFTDPYDLGNVSRYLEIFRPLYEDMLVILIHFGNDLVSNMNTTDKFVENLQRTFATAHKKGTDYLISFLGRLPEHDDFCIPTSIQSMPMYLMCMNRKEEGGTANGCV